ERGRRTVLALGRGMRCNIIAVAVILGASGFAACRDVTGPAGELPVEIDYANHFAASAGDGDACDFTKALTACDAVASPIDIGAGGVILGRAAGPPPFIPRV